MKSRSLLLLIALFSWQGVGSATTSSQLDYLIVKVNGQVQNVASGAEFAAVLGDVVVLEAAFLRDPARKIANVNFVGYLHPEAKRPAEDRGYEINTATDLIERWSLDRKGERYRIKVFTGRARHGEVYLRVVRPSLEFVELEINGKSRMLRPGELLQVDESDKFTVKSVRTNVEKDDENVSFQVVPLADHVDLPGIKFYEIRFTRSQVDFAKIPLQVSIKGG